MGRTITPKYIVKVRHAGTVVSTDSVWNSKQAGRPSAGNLSWYVEKYHESLQPGGVNAHVSAAYGNGARWIYAAICLNDGSGTVVAEWKAQ